MYPSSRTPLNKYYSTPPPTSAAVELLLIPVSLLYLMLAGLVCNSCLEWSSPAVQFIHSEHAKSMEASASRIIAERLSFHRAAASTPMRNRNASSSPTLVTCSRWPMSTARGCPALTTASNTCVRCRRVCQRRETVAVVAHDRPPNVPRLVLFSLAAPRSSTTRTPTLENASQVGAGRV